MLRAIWLGAAVLLVAACGGPDTEQGTEPSGPTERGTEPSGPTESEPEPSRTTERGLEVSCADTDIERIELAPSESRTTRHGLTVTLESTGHDQLEGGGFDYHATLRFERGGETAHRMPSLVHRDPSVPDVVLGSCVWVRDGGEGRVALEIGPETSR